MEDQFESLFKFTYRIFIAVIVIVLCTLGYKLYRVSTVEKNLDVVNKEQIIIDITKNSKQTDNHTICVPIKYGIIPILNSEENYSSEICYGNMARSYYDHNTYNKLLNKTSIEGYQYTVKYNGKLISFLSLNDELDDSDYLEVRKR